MKLDDEQKSIITEKLKRENATSIVVFGSYARGDANRDSDVDILANFEDEKTLIDMNRIERELSEILGMKVDLVTENSISPHISRKISEKEVLLA